MWATILGYIAMGISSILGMLAVFGDTRQKVTVTIKEKTIEREELTPYGKWTVGLLAISLITSIVCQIGKDKEAEASTSALRGAQAAALKESLRSRTWLNNIVFIAEFTVETSDKAIIDDITQLSRLYKGRPLDNKSIKQDLLNTLFLLESASFGLMLNEERSYLFLTKYMDTPLGFNLERGTHLDLWQSNDRKKFHVRYETPCSKMESGDFDSLEDLKGKSLPFNMPNAGFLKLSAVSLECNNVALDSENIEFKAGKWTVSFSKNLR